MIQIKRIYEPSAESDGTRILVDRLWPRGVKKETAHIDKWLKDIAPSTDLRKWFHQDTSQWDEFRAKYLLELKQNKALKDLQDIIKNNETVTLLFSVRDVEQNHALILKQFLTGN